MNTPAKWNRRGHVVIKKPGCEDWDSRKNGIELDFSFNITKPLAAVCMNAEIVLYGISRNTINSYSTWTAEALAMGDDMRIEVWVGYGEHESCIFSGTIFYAMPTPPPERSLKINARSGWDRLSLPINGDANEGTEKDELLPYDEWFKDAVKLIDGDINLSDYEGGDKNRKYSKIAFEGTATHQTVFNRMYQQATELMPKAYVIEDIEKDGRPQFKLINATVETRDKAEQRAIEVSKDTGMIGMPIVRYSDIEVTMLLEPAIERGGFVKLKTESLPNNGRLTKTDNGDVVISEDIYRVYETTYTGRLRGEQWYIKFKAWRFWAKGMAEK